MMNYALVVQNAESRKTMQGYYFHHRLLFVSTSELGSSCKNFRSENIFSKDKTTTTVISNYM